MKKLTLILFSCLTFILLNIKASLKGIFIGIIMIFLSYILLYLLRKKIGYKWDNIAINIVSLIVCIFSSIMFYLRWLPSSLVLKIASIFHLNNKIFLIILAVIGLICSLYFVSNVIYLLDLKFSYHINFYLEKHSDQVINYKISKKQKIFLLFIAVITITLFSKSSFLYPLNDWVDANCFFTVGKSILCGKVPYLDLMEQKGPLLYIIHTLAALISYESFIGVYFIEIIACYFFLYYTYKILLIFADKYIIYLLPFLSFLIYSSTSFCHGDSAEELCLPFIAYGLYLGLKILMNKDFLNMKEAIILGITSGCVLWIKYTMLGFYIGWIIIPIITSIKNRTLVNLLKMIVNIILGVILISIPIIIYFIYNDALLELFQTYFYNNMFLYSKSVGSTNQHASLIINEIYGFGKGLFKNIQFYILIFIGIYGLWKAHRQYIAFFIVTFISTAFFIYIGTTYPYYTFIMSIFSIFGLFPIYIILRNIIVKIDYVSIKTMGIYTLICFVTLCLCVLNNSNTYLLFKNKSSMPQYKFKEKICSVENPTLLNYGFLDGGFYTSCGIVPNCKYFCQLNIHLDEMYKTQNEYIDKGLVDFVVTRNIKLESDHYQLISTTSYYFEGQMFDYYLYQFVK